MAALTAGASFPLGAESHTGSWRWRTAPGKQEMLTNESLASLIGYFIPYRDMSMAAGFCSLSASKLPGIILRTLYLPHHLILAMPL